MSAKTICVEEDQQTSDDGDNNKKKVVINSLNSDSLAKIIMLLPIPERIEMDKVCTKWKEACQLAWYDIKKYKCESSIGRSYDNCLLTQSYLQEILLRCGNYLNELSLSDVCNSTIMPFVGDHCKNLTTLECKFDDNSLIDNADHFIQAFTQLNKLKCIKMLLKYTTEKKVINLFELINSLPEEIDEIHILSKYWLYDERAVLFTLKKFKNLQKLTLHGLCLDELILQEIAEATTLVHLNIELCDKHMEFPLFDNLVDMEYIQIKIKSKNEDNKVSTKVLNAIFCKCKNLKHLDIPNDFYDLGKIPLAKWENFKNLEYLSLSCEEVLPELADTIVKYCKNLKHLSIDPTCYPIKANVFKKLTKLENLESLEIFNKGLSDQTIIAISDNCKKLKRLKLDYCGVATDSVDNDPFPSVLYKLSKLQYLEHLSLYCTEVVKDNTIIAIANNCKNLKSFEIGGCVDDTITEIALVALTKLENLEILKVGLRRVISDNYIIRLKGLKEFHCNSCKKLTDTGIIQFIKNNPNLKRISAKGIDNITIDLVIGADQATKNRTNGIILHIKISNMSIIKVSKSIIKSQWLVVTG